MKRKSKKEGKKQQMEDRRLYSPGHKNLALVGSTLAQSSIVLFLHFPFSCDLKLPVASTGSITRSPLSDHESMRIRIAKYSKQKQTSCRRYAIANAAQYKTTTHKRLSLDPTSFNDALEAPQYFCRGYNSYQEAAQRQIDRPSTSHEQF